MDKTKQTPLFNFYDIVQLVNVDGEIAEVDRKFGIILGMTQADDGGLYYGVSVHSDSKCTDRIDGWHISEVNLTATGRKISEDHVFSGETIKVSPAGQQV